MEAHEKRARVGLGWRPQIAGDLLQRASLVDFVEVVAESCLRDTAARREVVALSAMWPVVPHGVKLSLGGAEPIDVERARRLGRLVRELHAPMVTEHVAFVRAGGREIGHLTPVPRTRAALAALERNVAVARRHLPDVPLALENVACTFQWPNSEMEEGDFYAEVVERTGCPLLLDVANLFANAVNEGRDPVHVAERFPLERVAMIHLAGGAWRNGFYFDDHGHALSAEVFSLLEWVLRRAPSVPILIERDHRFPPFAELASEVTRCRGVLESSRSTPTPPERRAPLHGSAHIDALKHQQADVARLLTAAAEPSEGEAKPFGIGAMTRTRDVLLHKRLDEALSLLPSLAAHGDRMHAIGQPVLAGLERPRQLAAVSDAWRIAERAQKEPALAELAARELLLLRSRFARSEDGAFRPRRTPFLGDVRSGDRRVWALKGPGAHAKVRIFDLGDRL